ncbi:hypothetical protein K438DRAFT_1981610 [Mycena galopus ATCC 62051]|nr:hypothetical protein K438DRAFT_1981610 [Mycena galopus ATCC 62051]
MMLKTPQAGEFRAAAPSMPNHSPGAVRFIPRVRIATIFSAAVLSSVWIPVFAVSSDRTLSSTLGLATACLTLTTGLMMFADLGYCRPGVWKSIIIAEVCWLSIVWIMWALTAIFGVLVNETGAIIAFPFINWILLMVYKITLPFYKSRLAPPIPNSGKKFIPRLRIGMISSVFILSLVWMAVVINMTVVDFWSPDTGTLSGVLGLVAAGLTLIMGLTMAVLGYCRPGLWRSMIIAEVCWLSFVWIMWAISAVFRVLPNRFFADEEMNENSVMGPIIAFPFVNWVLLMVYTIILPFYKSRLVSSAAKLKSEEAQIGLRSTGATIRTSGDETLVGHASIIALEKSADKDSKI